MKINNSVIAIVALLTLLVAVHFFLLDGLDGELCALMFQEDTVYAKGYSDWRFRMVKVGMNMHEVESLIGPPLGGWDGGGWFTQRWSMSAHDSHYRFRAINFTNGRVAGKQTGFYVD